MSDHSASNGKLPGLLRPALSRNVALLLESRIPARLSWVGLHGAPRIVPIWFVWTGDQLVMATFAGAAKLAELYEGALAAASIDTESFPYRSLRMGGHLSLTSLDGLADEYRAAAARYLGESAGRTWCRSLEGRPQVVLRLTPTWASASDMSRSPFLAEHG